MYLAPITAALPRKINRSIMRYATAGSVEKAEKGVSQLRDRSLPIDTLRTSEEQCC